MIQPPGVDDWMLFLSLTLFWNYFDKWCQFHGSWSG